MAHAPPGLFLVKHIVGKKRAELHRPTPTALASDSSAVDELVMPLYRAVNGQGHKLRRCPASRAPVTAPPAMCSDGAQSIRATCGISGL